MVRKKKALDDDGVAGLKPKKDRYAVQDTDQRGLYIRVTPKCVRTFYAVVVDLNGKVVWHRIEDAALMSIEDARAEARRVTAAIKKGEDKAGPQSFATVAESWFKRYVENKDRKLRSAPAIRRYLDKHILPAWAGREFAEITRGDVAKLLDTVEDRAGAVAADKVLAHLSGLFNWYATRHGDYRTPLVKGMRRSAPSERARERILTDAEIRAVWKAASANGTFGALVRLLLLTGQRRDKVAAMRWQDVSVDGVWTIPAEKREKGNAGELQLPAAAVEIIKAQPRFDGNPYVLAGRGASHFKGYSKGKKLLDAKAPMPQWQLHDLRRTARSLMSRAGIRPDIAERVLGHAIGGVGGIYDRHEYAEQKAVALRALAGLIDTIVNPPADNVVKFGSGLGQN